MSKEALEQVVLKASSDARFRAQMNDDFEAAIRPYDLSADEKAKLRSGIAGTSDDREVRRAMAASNATSVASSSQAGSAAAASEASSLTAASEASSLTATTEATSLTATTEATSTLTSTEATSATD